MSRRSRRAQPKSSPAFDDHLQRLVAIEVERRMAQIPPLALPPATPSGRNPRPINQDALLTQMQAQQAPAKQGTPMFAPGAPLTPATGLVNPFGPRQYQFPVGYNISVQPRSTESTSFDTLRNLAALYDGIQLCEQVWLDTVAKLNLVVRPRPEITAEQGSASDSKYADKIRKYTDFFAYPDPGNGYDLKSWLRAAVRDQLQIDAVAIYVRRNKAGGVYSLELVDGASVKPLIDPRGRRPQPPYPSYQQFLYGVPAGLYTSDEMLYQRETTRTESIYGLSRIERIIIRINQALRKENKDLARFTDGNIPPGILQPPDDGSQWTPETLLVYQEMWDAMLAGNDQGRSRIKVIQPGSQLTTLQEADIFVDFDRFLLNVTAACYSMTMADLGFTENVNKSSGESQQNVFYRRAVEPLMDRYSQLFTYILRTYFGEQDLVVAWSGFEESEDFNAMAASYVSLTNAGITSPTTAAHKMNLPWQGPEIPNFVLTKDGPIFLEDAADPGMRQAATQSKLAGLQFAAQNPGGPPKPTSDDEPPGNATPASKGNEKQRKGGATPRQSGEKGSASKSDDEDEGDRTVSPLILRGASKPAWRPPSKTQLTLEARLAKAIVAFIAQTKLSAAGVEMPDDTAREALLNNVHDVLSEAVDEAQRIATTSQAQRGLFNAAQNIVDHAVQLLGRIADQIREKAQGIIADLFGGSDTTTIDHDAMAVETQAQLNDWAANYSKMVAVAEISSITEETIADEMTKQGATLMYWVNDGNPCKICIENEAASPLPIGSEWPSGSQAPPAHPNCRCSIAYSM